VPVVRQTVLDKHPGLRGLLKQLGGILTVEEMRQLNYAVDGEKRQPKDVVRDFITKKGLLLDSRVAALSGRVFKVQGFKVQGQNRSTLARLDR
jgi:hypothetical protein